MRAFYCIPSSNVCTKSLFLETNLYFQPQLLTSVRSRDNVVYTDIAQELRQNISPHTFEPISR